MNHAYIALAPKLLQEIWMGAESSMHNDFISAIIIEDRLNLFEVFVSARWPQYRPESDKEWMVKLFYRYQKLLAKNPAAKISWEQDIALRAKLEKL